MADLSEIVDMPSRKLGLALLVAALAGIGGFSLAGLLLAGSPGGRAQESATRTPATIDYFSGTTRYAVPTKYNSGITRFNEKRNYPALSFMLFLPDFSPVADHPEEMKRPGWHDQITLLFEHGPRMSNPDEQTAILTNKPRGVHTSAEPTANGCDLYRTPLMMPGDVYVCPEDGSKLVLYCANEIDVQS